MHVHYAPLIQWQRLCAVQFRLGKARPSDRWSYSIGVQSLRSGSSLPGPLMRQVQWRIVQLALKNSQQILILSLLAAKSPTCIYLNMKTFMKGKKNPRSYRKLLIYPFKSSCATIPFRKKIRALFWNTSSNDLYHFFPSEQMYQVFIPMLYPNGQLERELIHNYGNPNI